MGSDRRRHWLHYCSLDNDACGRISPQGDEELARQGDNDRFAHPPVARQSGWEGSDNQSEKPGVAAVV
jgi:hypothetical protein